jgi:hypothetical protein
LLEYLAHARAHQVARGGVRIPVPASDARGLAVVDLALILLLPIFVHGAMVRRPAARVNHLR